MWRWRSRLRYCATSWKVAGSIPDGVTGIFHSHNPSGRTIALGLTQPLTVLFPEGQRRPVRRADSLTTFMCRLSCNLEASTCWNPQGLSRPVVGLLYLLPFSLLSLIPRLPPPTPSYNPVRCAIFSSYNKQISTILVQ